MNATARHISTVRIIGLNKELDLVEVIVDGDIIHIAREANGKFPSMDEIIRQAKEIAKESHEQT